MSEPEKCSYSSGVSIEEYLKQHDTLTYRNVGASMLPLLKQGRDLFTVTRKTDERCRKYDVALYKRKDGAYVLHRIVEVRKDDYVFLGDNCIEKEYGITDQDIRGIMVSFVHRGNSYSVEDFCYRLYVRIWCAMYPLRCAYKRVHAFVSRGLHRLGLRK